MVDSSTWRFSSDPLRAVAQNSTASGGPMGPDHQPQPMLALPKQLSPNSTSIISVAPTPKTGSPFFSNWRRASFAAELCDLAASGFLLLSAAPVFIPPHLTPRPHHVLPSSPDIAGSASPRCSARSSCLNQRPEDRHDQCGFGAGRQEHHPRGESGEDGCGFFFATHHHRCFDLHCPFGFAMF